MLGHTRHVSLEDTHITLLPPGSAAQPLGWEPTFVSSSFLLPLLFLGSTCLSRGKARVSRQAEQLMQKKCTAEEKLWVSPRSLSLPVHVLESALPGPHGGQSQRFKGLSVQGSVLAMWQFGAALPGKLALCASPGHHGAAPSAVPAFVAAHSGRADPQNNP